MTERTYDPVPESTLLAAAKNGRAYTNEVEAMAKELQELRARHPFGPWEGKFTWGGVQFKVIDLEGTIAAVSKVDGN